MTYINDGDWVESCTAAVEHFDGRFEILDWAAERRWSPIAKTQTSLAPPEPEVAAA